jgi:hypothetical protein
LFFSYSPSPCCRGIAPTQGMTGSLHAAMTALVFRRRGPSHVSPIHTLLPEENTFVCERSVPDVDSVKMLPQGHVKVQLSPAADGIMKIPLNLPPSTRLRTASLSNRLQRETFNAPPLGKGRCKKIVPKGRGRAWMSEKFYSGTSSG